MPPSLVFSMSLADLPVHFLRKGVLNLRRRSQDAGMTFEATSGLPNYQYQGSWILKGRGCIPPSTLLPSDTWHVSTQRLWMPNTKGIQGSFYSISPFEIDLGGIVRGDFGLHQDKGVKGSAGCIVIPGDETWNMFDTAFAQLRREGHQQVTLRVIYT